MTGKNEPFHRTHSKTGEPWDEYRIEGDSVVRERVTPGATISGGVRREIVKTWKKDEVLFSDIDLRAKGTYQKLLGEKGTQGT